MQASKDGIFDYYPETGEVYYSPGWAEILGFSIDEIDPYYSFWEEKIHPEDRDNVLNILLLHLEGKIPLFHVEHRIRMKSGQRQFQAASSSMSW